MPSTQPEGGNSERNTFLLILLGALIFRISFLTSYPLWGDEFVSLFVAKAPDLKTLFAVNASGAEPHPPAYHLILRFLIQRFGDSEFVLRSYSVAWSLVLLVAVRGVLRELKFPLPTVTWTLALIGCSALQIHYAQEGRMYAQACALVYLALWAHLRLLDRGGIASFLAAIASSALAGSSHYIAAGLAIALLPTALTLGTTTGRKIGSLAATLTAGILLLPWYATARFHPPNGETYIMARTLSFSPDQLKPLLASVSQQVLGVSMPRLFTGPFDVVNDVCNVSTLALITLASGIGLSWLVRRPQKITRLDARMPPRRSIFVLVLLIVVFWGGPALLFITRGFRWYARYLIFAGPAIFAIVALGLNRWPRRIRVLAQALMLLLGLTGTIAYYADTGLREPWPAIASEARTRVNAPGIARSRTLVVVARGTGDALRYYARDLDDRIFEYPFPQDHANLAILGHTYTRPERFQDRAVASGVADENDRVVLLEDGANLGLMTFVAHCLANQGFHEVSATLHRGGLDVRVRTLERASLPPTPAEGHRPPSSR